jgi:hypothetical protein
VSVSIFVIVLKEPKFGAYLLKSIREISDKSFLFRLKPLPKSKDKAPQTKRITNKQNNKRPK